MIEIFLHKLPICLVTAHAHACGKDIIHHNSLCCIIDDLNIRQKKAAVVILQFMLVIMTHSYPSFPYTIPH